MFRSLDLQLNGSKTYDWPKKNPQDSEGAQSSSIREVHNSFFMVQ